jgi:hypothetical protein
MEKHERFSEIRKGSVPRNLQTKYNGIAKLVLQMTNIEISKRPTAKAVVKAVETEIMRLENNTLGLGVSGVLTQRSRFYSYDEKDRKDQWDQNDVEDSYTLIVDNDSEYSELGNSKSPYKLV